MFLNRMKHFQVRFDISVDAVSEDIWPDGDGPAHPTALDVARQIANDGVGRVGRGWDLSGVISVTDSHGKTVDIEEVTLRLGGQIVGEKTW